MKYFEDPLLKSKKAVLNKDVLNLYSALVKIEDFSSRRSLSSIPYLTGRIAAKVNPLISKEIIKRLGEYMQREISKKTIRHWEKENIVPFPLIRVLSLMERRPIKKLSDYIKLTDGIITTKKAHNLKLPRFFDELLSNKFIYFYGYLLGDGCMSKERVIKLCDGHQNPKYVKFSLLFLESFQKYIKDIFNLPSKLTKIGNKYELVLTSKYFCRFLKFFYNFQKDKGIIAKPSIIRANEEKSSVFYRGFFDADAGIKVKDKHLVLKCIDKRFLQVCKKDFKRYNIDTAEISYDNFDTPSFSIHAQNLYDYSKKIGFNHPRKQRILIDHLKKGCLIKRLYSINKNNLIDNQFYDLSKIKNLRIKGVSSIFKKYRKELGTQQEVSNLLSTFRENIKRWENGRDSIPFKDYLKLMELKGVTKLNVLKDLSKRDISFGKGNLKQFITLPIRFNNAHFETFQYLNPLKNKVVIKSYCIKDRKIDRIQLFNKFKKIFNIKIIKDSHSDVACSNLVSSFLNTFYKYSSSWDPILGKDISILKNRWSVFQL